MTDIELFVQGEGLADISLIRVSREGCVGDILRAVRSDGGAFAGDEQTVIILKENTTEALALDLSLEAVGIGHRSRVHLHRCRLLDLTVNFNGRTITRAFPPSTTVKHVKQWTVGNEGFHLHDLDATEHLLQLCGFHRRPDEDVHIGALVQFPDCNLCFDLVPKQRVEG